MLEALVFILITLIIIFLILYLKEKSARTRLQQELSIRAADEARRIFDEWRQRELQQIQQQLRESFENQLKIRVETLQKDYEAKLENMKKEYELKFQQWIKDKEAEIREDAIKRSITTLLGKISEHIAPLLIAQKLGINPKDLRFLGTPIDYIAFKGLSDKEPEEIVFIEVKSGKTSVLTERERAVKKLVEAGKIRWITFHITKEIEELKPIIEEVKKLAKPSETTSEK